MQKLCFKAKLDYNIQDEKVKSEFFQHISRQTADNFSVSFNHDTWRAVLSESQNAERKQ